MFVRYEKEHMGIVDDRLGALHSSILESTFKAIMRDFMKGSGPCSGSLIIISSWVMSRDVSTRNS